MELFSIDKGQRQIVNQTCYITTGPYYVLLGYYMAVSSKPKAAFESQPRHNSKTCDQSGFTQRLPACPGFLFFYQGLVFKLGSWEYKGDNLSDPVYPCK
jgi:hypothetical protein